MSATTVKGCTDLAGAKSVKGGLTSAFMISLCQMSDFVPLAARHRLY